MVSKEYLSTARTLLGIAKNMTDQTIADRLKGLAEGAAPGKLVLRNRQKL
jgi:hypothetical protein